MIDKFQFVMHAGPTPGKTYIIDNPEIILGRDLRNTIVINDTEVSRSHCRISTYENGIYIEDLNSTNGTFINGKAVSTPSIISVGDILKIGETVTMVLEELYPSAEKTIIAPNSPAYIPPAMQPDEPASAPHITKTPPPTQAAYVSPPKNNIISQPLAKKQKKTSKAKAIIITIIFMLLLLAIIVSAFLWYVDANYLWCDFFGFLISGC